MAKTNEYKPNGYALSRAWFDFALDNPDLVSGNHTALYLWIVEINNRSGWKDKFGLTVREAMDGMSCKSRTTYFKCFQNLIEWKFIEIVVPAKNQYQCNIIAIPNNVQAQDDHLYRHRTVTSTDTNTDSSKSTSTDTGTILKPLNPETQKPEIDKQQNVNEDFINELVRDFEFTESRFAIQAKKIMEFVNILSFNSTLDHFKIQYKNYREFKKLSGQTSHNFYSFIGTSDKKYQDGAWNIDNWEAKLKTEKSKTNGTTNKSNAGIRSNNTSTGRKEFGKL
jgi:hypothetical protein